MSRIRANSITNAEGTGAPLFPNGLSVTGVITATSFGGNVTGNATGLSGTPNITVGIVTATEFDISGSSNTFNASGISVGVLTATSSIAIGSTDVLTAINAKASTGKAIAMSMVFG